VRDAGGAPARDELAILAGLAAMALRIHSGRRAGAAVDAFGLRSNEIPDAARRRVLEEFPRLGFKREFAALWRAEARQVPRGRAWYLHRFVVTDLSFRMAPFG
jgi:hypothetical protein